jgi:hypothetical protein
MATDFTEETASDAVISSFAPSTDPRLREVLTSLVRHLHGFAREVELTIPEWNAAIDFLTRTGHKCDDDRQEFILLSDVSRSGTPRSTSSPAPGTSATMTARSSSCCRTCWACRC